MVEHKDSLEDRMITSSKNTINIIDQLLEHQIKIKHPYVDGGYEKIFKKIFTEYIFPSVFTIYIEMEPAKSTGRYDLTISEKKVVEELKNLHY